MIFTRKTNTTDTLMDIKIDDVPVQKVDQTRFLGVIINDNYYGMIIIKTIRIKICKGLGILARLRHCLPSRILVNLYYTLVHPYFDYCNIIWATGSSTSLSDVNFDLYKKLSYRTQYVDGIYSNSVTLKSRLGVTQGHRSRTSSY